MKLYTITTLRAKNDSNGNPREIALIHNVTDHEINYHNIAYLGQTGAIQDLKLNEDGNKVLQLPLVRITVEQYNRLEPELIH